MFLVDLPMSQLKLKLIILSGVSFLMLLLLHAMIIPTLSKTFSPTSVLPEFIV